MDLFSKKFSKNICFCDSCDKKVLKDLENDTFFIIANQNIVFKDALDTFWITIPKSFRINGELIQPYIGMTISVENGPKYIFASKEEITQRAIDYFEAFAINSEMLPSFHWSIFNVGEQSFEVIYKNFNPAPKENLGVEYSYN